MGFHVRNNNPSVRAGRSGGGRQASQLSKRHFYVLFIYLFIRSFIIYLFAKLGKYPQINERAGGNFTLTLGAD